MKFKISQHTQTIAEYFKALLQVHELSGDEISMISQAMNIVPEELKQKLVDVIKCDASPLFDGVHEQAAWYDPNLNAMRILVSMDTLISIPKAEVETLEIDFGLTPEAVKDMVALSEEDLANYADNPWHGFA